VRTSGVLDGRRRFYQPKNVNGYFKTLTGGDLWSYLTSKEQRIKRANKLFDWISGNKITIVAPTTVLNSEGKSA
jgi:NADPH2:quinone reductase